MYMGKRRTHCNKVLQADDAQPVPVSKDERDGAWGGMRTLHPGSAPGDAVADPDEVSSREVSRVGWSWRCYRIEPKSFEGRLSIERQNIEHQVGGRRMGPLHQGEPILRPDA